MEKSLIGFLLLTYAVNLAIASKLNVPRVLLPYNQEVPSNFTLKVQEKGCFTWSSSRNVVGIKEISPNNGCAQEIIVTALTRSSVRQTAIILAKEKGTGESLRCDVIVDSIHRLEIVTTTRELYVEEAPEEFEVRAYDDQGNQFTSMEGQHFTWDIQSISDRNSASSTQNVLRFITFEASPYKAPPAISPLESKGSQGYMVLVEGKQTGLARLSVRLENPLYKNVVPAYVDLMVIANLILEPQDVYILPHTTVEYSVFHLKQGIFHPVAIKGPQYSLQVAEKTIGKLQRDGISITGLSIGTTIVKLQDNNVKSSQTIKQPTASLQVVDPAYMTITIVPQNNPNLINGHSYTFLVNLFDSNSNKILSTDNLMIRTSIPGEFFSTEFKTKNGTYLHGVPIQTGTTAITASLSAVEMDDTIMEISPPIEASLTLEISDVIKVIPPVTVLPWNPVTKPTYNVTLSTEKASGLVAWSSSLPSVAQVSHTGHCTTRATGKTIITAALASNIHNSDTGEIHVKEASSLSLVPGIVEAEVGKPMPLHIALFTSLEGMDQVLFSSCSQIPYNVQSQDSTFISTKEVRGPETHQSCAAVDVIGQTAGFSTVSVTYKSTAGDLTENALVAAYNPLRSIHPVTGESTLALHSSRILLFEGGPLPWLNKPSGHYVQVKVDNTNIGSAHIFRNTSAPRSRPDIHAIKVECETLGEMRVTITVGNRPSSTLPFPEQAVAFVTVSCALPDTITLQTVPRTSAANTMCPSDSELGYSIAHCNKPLPLEIVVSDSLGRTFDNISSLAFDWTLSNSEIGSIANEGSIKILTTEVHGFSVPLRGEQLLQTKGIPGDLKINVQMSGHKIGSSNTESLLHIHFVNEATLSTDHVVLFNHKDSQGEVVVSGGSGFFQLANVNPKIALVDYFQEDRTIVVHPVSDGNASVTLVDACLETVNRPVLHVKVASIGSIDLEIVDRVELDDFIMAEVIVKDTEGVIVPVHSQMMLSPHIQSDLVEIVQDRVNAVGNAVYKVIGKQVGDTNIRFSTKKSPLSSLLVYSKFKSVQVFPPLTLEPSNITLIVGASYQIKTKGGPYPDATIEFSVANTSVSVTSHSGILNALNLGLTQLTAKAISPQRNGSELVVYSKNSVTVRVIPMHRIHIHAPLNTIEAGSTMPLYAVGDKKELTPLSYGSAEPGLKFEWSISNKAVASLRKPYEENGVEESPENASVLRLEALKAGRVNIKLKVTVMVSQPRDSFQLMSNIVLEDTIEIKVFESLRLLSPSTGDAKLLMTPNSRTPIVTNLAHDGMLSYDIDSVTKSSKTPLIMITADGIVHAGPSVGQATITVTRIESSGVKQRLAVLVEVLPVKYILTTPQIFMRTASGETIDRLPTGSSHGLRVTFHDNRGRVFNAAHSDLTYRASRFDLINILQGPSNESISITVRGSGTTVLQITDSKNVHVNDFIKISAGPVIQLDKNSIAVGENICPRTSLLSIDNEPGTWKTDSPNMVIDSESGVGMGRRPGKAVIYNEFSTTLSTSVEVTVLPLKKISIDVPTSVMSNTDIGRRMFVPVTFSADNGEASWTPCDSTQDGSFYDLPCNASGCHKMSTVTPFVCNAHFASSVQGVYINDVVSTSVVFHPNKGYACSVASVVGPISSWAKESITLLLEATSNDVRSRKVQIPFYPAAVADKDELQLTDQESSAKVSIVGQASVLEAFKVSSEEALFSVSIEKTHSTLYKVIVTAKDVAWGGNVPLGTTILSLHSPVNMQTIEIKINMEQLGPGICTDPGRQVGLIGLLVAILSHYQSVLISFVCIGVTALFMIIAYRSLVGPGYKQSEQDGVFASSEPSKNVTIADLSPAVEAWLSTPRSVPNRRQFGSTSPASPSGRPLWSVDREPVYGDPLFRSSPKTAYEY